MITVKNGKTNPTLSNWRVIEDIDDIDSITAKRRPDEQIGVIGLDFDKLPEAEFPLVEVLLRFWPGNAFEQLKKLNIKFKRKYPSKPLVTLEDFFTFFACLLAAAPAGYGGIQLWHPPSVKGVFPHADLNKYMSFNRFKDIKSCYAAAFACDSTHVVKEGEAWSPVEGKTPVNDEWAHRYKALSMISITIVEGTIRNPIN